MISFYLSCKKDEKIKRKWDIKEYIYNIIVLLLLLLLFNIYIHMYFFPFLF
jgi:hypothetical protein